MNQRDRIELLIWVALLMMAVVVVGQQPAPPPGEVLRQIDDPGAHGSWLLIRDPVHRAGPGRFIWVPRAQTNHTQGDTRASSVMTAYKPVILAGDRLVIEEETPVVDARMAATALEPAPVGSAFNARLEIAGKVVRVIALGPGRAQFAPETQSAPGPLFETGARP